MDGAARQEISLFFHDNRRSRFQERHAENDPIQRIGDVYKLHDATHHMTPGANYRTLNWIDIISDETFENRLREYYLMLMLIAD